MPDGLHPNDCVIDQNWAAYTADQHAIWAALYDRQMALLPGRAADVFVDGLHQAGLTADAIPDFAELSGRLGNRTGWSVVAVPGLISDRVFFDHLANRRFPAGSFIRRADQFDYIEEPDVFHDVFGHVPMLAEPVFADFLEAYGRAGLAADSGGRLHRLARLYWYTVEFGLISTGDGLRIFGAGILSSPAETIFALENPSPNRIAFDTARVMATRYRIDDFQESYFVLDSLEALLDTMGPSLGAAYARSEEIDDLEPGDIRASDGVITRGSGHYHHPPAGQAAATVR